MAIKSNSKKDRNSNRVTWKELWFFPFVLILFFGSWWYLSTFHPDTQERGSFGDQFGIVNALFSGLAFAGLLYTIILQRKDLNLQYNEMEDNRKELKRQTEEFKAQNDNLRIQRFENTFFNMLEQLQQIVNGLSIHYQEKIKVKETTTDPGTPYIEKEEFVNRSIQGRDLFRFAFVEAPHYPPKGKEINGLGSVMRIEGFRSYMDSYTPTYFDHYFRFIYTILTFIKKNDWLGFEAQYGYAKMLRAILSRYELVWLFYNGLSDYGQDKLKPLIEEYSMLKNLRPDLLTICRENLLIVSEKGLSHNDLTSAEFSGTDFEFRLTEWDEDDKYHIMAFYNMDHIEEGKDYLKKWHDYLQSHTT